MPHRTCRGKYKEGDLFAVPLRDGGYAAGVVARGKKKVLLGYFFGLRWESVPQLDDLCGLDPQSAIFIARFGDLGLMNCDWVVLGQCPKWDPSEWASPTFKRVDTVSGAATIVQYADEEPSRMVSETVVSLAEAASLPEDGLWGAGAVEIRLTKLLSQQAPR